MGNIVVSLTCTAYQWGALLNLCGVQKGLTIPHKSLPSFFSSNPAAFFLKLFLPIQKNTFTLLFKVLFKSMKRLL